MTTINWLLLCGIFLEIGWIAGMLFERRSASREIRFLRRQLMIYSPHHPLFHDKR